MSQYKQRFTTTNIVERISKAEAISLQMSEKDRNVHSLQTTSEFEINVNNMQSQLHHDHNSVFNAKIIFQIV